MHQRGQFPNQGYDPSPFPKGIIGIEVDVSGIHQLIPLDCLDPKRVGYVNYVEKSSPWM